eukprot:TRINITY_DN16094_c0_g1_i3.p1 TRINITY_DN16094_c0_g1~~TRINITY_DN16094_c0_g1_i3.p1  ORF type:complete len:262 (-),score=27.37 TRINITY_DN16094_c0_g1_i3:29-814(-)
MCIRDRYMGSLLAMQIGQILILMLLCGLSLSAIVKARDPEEDHDHEKSFSEYLTSYGYNFETHKAVTKDGYLITLWRIPKKISEKRSSRHPVLLQHGVMDNAFSWLYKNMYKNLPIMLVDLGYDVWLGNNRGTIHSLEHVDIQEHNSRKISGKYWEFSFDEMGLYDLPAMIDYISDITGQPKVSYIGHSQGTSQFFVKSMVDPESVSYTHLRAHETSLHLVCRLLLEKKKKNSTITPLTHTNQAKIQPTTNKPSVITQTNQ